MTDGAWKDIGVVSDIPVAGGRVVKSNLCRVAVFRTAADEIFAMEDRCPHRAGPLSQGIVHGAQVTCPLHNWVIDLASGSVVGPDEGCVKTIPVKIERGRRILIDLSVHMRPVS